MTVIHLRQPLNDNATDNIVALHCSLGSGEQWAKLIEACDLRYNAVAPDISGYGRDVPCADPAPSRLDMEVEHLSEKLRMLTGPIHLVGHSFGGAVAFKLATSGRYAHRVRSLTLIEPVLPAILLEHDADRPLYELFARGAAHICAPLWSGDRELALQRFLTFWNGPRSWDSLSPNKKVALLEHVTKLAGDFAAIFDEGGVCVAARRLSVPTLLISGGKSPQPTRQIVRRLASMISNVRYIHVPEAGHLLPITHASDLNPKILRHIDAAQSKSGLGLPLKARAGA
ncbi:pimeloyl-ACP methyl ester carboxylesterase [Nitrobacteraceae bacterium AZCC 1564]